MATAKQEAKRVIVVLSVGRSGTSLLMQALGALGMNLSENLIGPHHENPDGFFEDVDVVNLHKQLLADLGAKPILPLPAGWKESAAVAPYRSRVRALVEERMSKADTIWGFKDPRTCALLPLWIDVLKSMWVMPSFILAVRDPGAAVRSIIKQASLSGEMAELVWLFRTCDALHNAAGDCHIVHYEDWFTRPAQAATDLLQHTGLATHFKGDISVVLDGIIKPNLNRAVHDEYKVTNPYVLKLYETLKECRGTRFDRVRLMQVVKECRMAMDSFRGWYMEAQKHSTPETEITQVQAQTKKRLERKQAEVDQLIAKVTTLEVSLETERVKYTQVVAEMEQKAASVQQADRVKHAQAIAEVVQEAAIAQQAERVKHAEAIAELNKKIAGMSADLEQLTLQNNDYLKQVKALHDRAEGLAIKLQGMIQPAPVIVRQPVKQGPDLVQGAAGTASMSQKDKATRKPSQKGGDTKRVKEVNRQPLTTGRGGKLWKKLKKDPQRFFADSRVTVLRPLRNLFKSHA